jgi:translation initiation factor IF-2
MARKTADKEGVRIEYYSIIYNLIQRLRWATNIRF